jgi:hypothetical protein
MNAKYLINLLVVLLSANNLLAQEYYFGKKPFIIDEFDCIGKGIVIPKATTCYYSFDVNVNHYIVSYAKDEEFKQNAINKDSTIATGKLYLHRWDSIQKSWVIASDFIQTDYYLWVNNIHNCSMIEKISNQGVKDAHIIKIEKSECIVLIVENFYVKNDAPKPYYYSIIVLVPDGKDTYKSTSFEQINKSQEIFPVCSKIDDYDNEFIIMLSNGIDPTPYKLDFTIHEDKTVSLICNDNNYSVFEKKK